MVEQTAKQQYVVIVKFVNAESKNYLIIAPSRPAALSEAVVKAQSIPRTVRSINIYTLDEAAEALEQ